MADETNIAVDEEETTEETPVELIPMEEFIAKIKAKTITYGVKVSDLSVELAIEQFETIRNYPSSWDDEKKLTDMENNKAKITMAAIEIDSKDGAEGQNSHSENGISRTWTDSIMAYKNVVGFADIF